MSGPIKIDDLAMTYAPYPFGVIAPVFDEKLYDELLSTFPKMELFKFHSQHGAKYSLSERSNREQYEKFIASHAAWREVHAFIKSDDFIFTVLDALRDHDVDLGFKRSQQSRGKRIKKAARSLMRGRLPSVEAPLYSRFEFSALPAHGGVVTPHTDAPEKFVTIVFSMVRPGEWQDQWGGGTDILLPKDETKSFNYMNKQVPYDQTEMTASVPYKPNQAMIFVKTHNSLHGVRQMVGPEGAMRRTLTVVIERG
ncbi:hypothetical protein ACFQI3_06205 [Hansschlegelia quercus]|uniref:2OG-Fe(II) oxygenase n=1 Tax=Hansschlegelia quercus TaxID=2528245 RepID=A0A4Q9GI17_9HYPH|nr:hypothetical protein [Hansschlegelia quercus]TBN53849.1 hypothetical protein EYR15_08635 [Hansschlegelia quercus]